MGVILLLIHTHGYRFFFTIFRSIAPNIQRSGLTHVHSKCVGLLLGAVQKLRNTDFGHF